MEQFIQVLIEASSSFNWWHWLLGIGVAVLSGGFGIGIVFAIKEFESTAGGGAVSVKVTGEKLVKEIKLKPEVVDPEDVEMLQDLILTCVNDALKKVDSAQAASMGKFNIPGIM